VGRGEDLVSSLNKLTARDWGTCVPTSPRTSLTASNGEPHKLGPTSGLGQCLASDVSQGVEEWSDVDHQDVLMCPSQQSEGDVTSGRVRWVPDHTLVISREKPRSRGVHACGVNGTFRRSTRKEPLGELRPVRVTYQWYAACMAHEQLGHSQDGWPQRLGAQVGTPVVIPSEVALQ